MASSSSDYRTRAVVGELPQGFLQLDPGPSVVQDNVGPRAQQQFQQLPPYAHTVLQPQQFARPMPPRLKVTLVKAQIAKSHSYFKMDPYCRVRVGHYVFETPTVHNGDKSPAWNKTVLSMLEPGIDMLQVEVYDEKSFSVDRQIGTCAIDIPSSVLRGETCDEWYDLLNEEGNVEGSINVVLTLLVSAPAPQVQQPVVYVSNTGLPIASHQQQQGMVIAPPPRNLHSEDDLKQIKEMFPQLDAEICQAVLVSHGGNKDMAINALLQMT